MTEKSSPQPVPGTFPVAIWQLLLEVADRKGTKHSSPWEGPDGEPLQDDADAAIAWIKAAIPAPDGGERAAFEADIRERVGLTGGYLNRDPAGYANEIVEASWQGWQARAALAAQPQAHPDGSVNPTPQTPVECSVCGGLVVGVVTQPATAPAPHAAPEVMLNGLTEAETLATASVVGFVSMADYIAQSEANPERAAALARARNARPAPAVSAASTHHADTSKSTAAIDASSAAPAEGDELTTGRQYLLTPEYGAAMVEMAKHYDMSVDNVLRAAIRLYQAQRFGSIKIEHVRYSTLLDPDVQPKGTTVAWTGYTSEQIADACVAAEIPDSKYESLVLALAETQPPNSPPPVVQAPAPAHAAPVEPSEFWVLELFTRGGGPAFGRYFAGFSLEEVNSANHGTADIHAAKQYPSKADAEAAAERLNQRLNTVKWQAIEHGWIAPAPRGVGLLTADEVLVGELVAATLAEEREHSDDASDAEKDTAANRFIRAKDKVLRALAASPSPAVPHGDAPASYRRDYPTSEAVLGAEHDKAKEDLRAYGVSFCVNGWHVPADKVSCWGMERASELTRAARDVVQERRRQVYAEGWTAEHDDEHDSGDLAAAGAAYAIEANALLEGMEPSETREPPFCWPWAREWWKSKDARRNLVKAGALILAELERLDRVSLVPVQGSQP